MADRETTSKLILQGDSSPLETSLQRGSVAVSTLQGQVEGLTGGFGSLTGGIKGTLGILGPLSAALAGGALFKEAISTTNTVNGEVQKLSKSLGITTTQASVCRIALDDAFLTVEDMTGGAQRLTRQLLTNEDAFKKLGVQTRDNSGNYRDIVSIMTDVNDKLRQMKEGTDQNVAGTAIYGKGWAEARGLLKLSSEAMAEARDRAEELHLMIGPEQIAASRKYKLAMKDIEDVNESVKVQIGNELIPILTSLAIAFGEAGTKGAGFFARELRENMRSIAEFKLSVKSLLVEAGVIFDGGALGSRWFSKSGRAEIKAELEAQDQLWQHGLWQIAEKYGNYNRAVQGGKIGGMSLDPDLMGGSSRGGRSGAGKDRGLSSQAKSEMKRFFENVDEEVRAELASDDYIWNTFSIVATMAAPKSANQAAADRTSALLGKSQKNNFSLWSPADQAAAAQDAATAATNASGGLTDAQQSLVNNEAMLSQWAAQNAASRQLELDAERQFYAARDEQAGNSLTGQMYQIDQEREAWIQSWAMQTDSFEEYERRKAIIEQRYSAQRKKTEQEETSYKMNLAAGFFHNTASIANSFYQLSGQKSKEALRSYQVLKSGETIITTADTAMKSYNALAMIPYVGPVLGAAAAGAAIMYGMEQLDSIWSVGADGSGGSFAGASASAGSASGGATSAVTQPVPASEPQQQVQIIIKPDLLIGDHRMLDRWVEDVFAPTMREKLGRGVDFGVVTA